MKKTVLEIIKENDLKKVTITKRRTSVFDPSTILYEATLYLNCDVNELIELDVPELNRKAIYEDNEIVIII